MTHGRRLEKIDVYNVSQTNKQPENKRICEPKITNMTGNLVKLDDMAESSLMTIIGMTLQLQLFFTVDREKVWWVSWKSRLASSAYSVAECKISGSFGSFHIEQLK